MDRTFQTIAKLKEAQLIARELHEEGMFENSRNVRILEENLINTMVLACEKDDKIKELERKLISYKESAERERRHLLKQLQAREEIIQIFRSNLKYLCQTIQDYKDAPLFIVNKEAFLKKVNELKFKALKRIKEIERDLLEY